MKKRIVILAILVIIIFLVAVIFFSINSKVKLWELGLQDLINGIKVKNIYNYILDISLIIILSLLTTSFFSFPIVFSFFSWFIFKNSLILLSFFTIHRFTGLLFYLIYWLLTSLIPLIILIIVLNKQYNCLIILFKNLINKNNTISYNIRYNLIFNSIIFTSAIIYILFIAYIGLPCLKLFLFLV